MMFALPEEFRFAVPEMLWALPVLVALFALGWWLKRRARPRAMTFSTTADLAELPHTLKMRIVWLPKVIRFVVCCLIVIGLARPQFGKSREEVTSLGVDIALAVDLSDSMQADDFQPNRLAVAKETMIEFVQGRPSDNFAIVGFGRVAALLCPLTPEYDIIAQFISRLTFDVLGPETAMGDAIALATQQLEKSEAKSKLIVLLTDGERTAGEFDPLQAAEASQALGIRIYTIGIGSNQTRRNFFQLTTGMSFNPEVLRSIAEMTGGAYFHASDEERFDKIFEEIDQLERTRIERKLNRDYKEQMHLVIFPALLLLIIEVLLRRTWLKVLP